jgi:hypothetical protein
MVNEPAPLKFRGEPSGGNMSNGWIRTGFSIVTVNVSSAMTNQFLTTTI